MHSRARARATRAHSGLRRSSDRIRQYRSCHDPRHRALPTGSRDDARSESADRIRFPTEPPGSGCPCRPHSVRRRRRTSLDRSGRTHRTSAPVPSWRKSSNGFASSLKISGRAETVTSAFAALLEPAIGHCASIRNGAPGAGCTKREIESISSGRSTTSLKKVFAAGSMQSSSAGRPLPSTSCESGTPPSRKGSPSGQAALPGRGTVRCVSFAPSLRWWRGAENVEGFDDSRGEAIGRCFRP